MSLVLPIHSGHKGPQSVVPTSELGGGWGAGLQAFLSIISLSE